MKYLILALIVFLPFHSVFISGFLAIYVVEVSFWKELVVAAMISTLLVTGRIRLSYQNITLALASLLMIIYCSILFFVEPSVGAFAGLKNYILPWLGFLCILGSRLTSSDCNDLLRLFEKVAVFSVVYALFQAYILGDSFLLAAGFEPNIWNSAKLKFSFYINEGQIQRANGGFAGPIVFAVYLYIAILLYYERVVMAKGKLGVVGIIILIGFLATMVRSAFLALAIVYVVFYWKDFRKIINWKNLLYAIFAIVFLVILAYKWNGLYETIAQFWSMSVGGAHDPSKVGHFLSYTNGMKAVGDYPLLGRGLGTYGPLAPLYFENGEVVESTLLSLFLELGLIGSVLTLLPLLFLYLNENFGAGRKIMAGVFVIGLFLPIQYYVEINLLMMVVLGLLIRRKVAGK